MQQAWQAQLSDTINDLPALYAYLRLDRVLSEEALKAAEGFPLKVPKHFADRIEKGNPVDPLLRQVLADEEEMKPVDGFIHDPLQEAAFNKQTGLLHKYHGRVLVMLHGQCAIHCRYCFRRHFPYSDNIPGKQGFASILEQLKQDPSIEEVIFSGGDPLVSSDKHLAFCLAELEKLPQIKRIRFHTRLPIVIPSRVTEGLIEVLKQSSKAIVMVVHSNCAQEINEDVENALQALRPHCTLLNQFVLLNGVNDSVEALVGLSQRLFDCGVLPYYCHLPDRVAGTAHFDVARDKAISLINGIKSQLPGYLVPKLAQEIPHKAAKTVLA